MVANMKWKKIHVKEFDHKPVLMDFQKQLNYRERKAEAKTEEEGGVKDKKKTIRALRDRARYLEKKMAIAEAINPKTKDLEVQMELLRMELVSIRQKISASMD